MKSYGDNEHGEANKCLIELFHVEIVVGLTNWLITVTFIANEKTRAWGSNPPPFDL